jgi:hypothetical protein
VGWKHITVRLAVSMRELAAERLEPGAGWPALYDSYEEMEAHQTMGPDDPDDHLPDDWREIWGDGLVDEVDAPACARPGAHAPRG